MSSPRNITAKLETSRRYILQTISWLGYITRICCIRYIDLQWNRCTWEFDEHSKLPSHFTTPAHFGPRKGKHWNPTNDATAGTHIGFNFFVTGSSVKKGPSGCAHYNWHIITRIQLMFILRFCVWGIKVCKIGKLTEEEERNKINETEEEERRRKSV